MRMTLPNMSSTKADRYTLYRTRSSRKLWNIALSTFVLSLFFVVSGFSQTCVDPTPTILGDFSVCPGETVTYNVDTFNVGYSYDYTLNAGGTIISSTDGEVTIEWDDEPGGPYQLNLTESIDTCTGSTVEFIEIEGDAILVCNDNLNISLALACEVTFTPDIILEAPEFPDDSYLITVRDANGNIIPTTLGSAYIGQTVEVTVEHICTGNQCWGDVTLEDKLPPQIMCENDTLTCDEFQFFTPQIPTLVADNCGDATLDFSIVDEDQPCGSDYSLIRSITWIATDGSGNVSAPCTQMIYVERVTLDSLDFPLNYDGLVGNNDPLSCSGNFPTNADGYPDPSFTGEPGGDAGCSTIEWTYTDVELPLCDQTCDYINSNYKIIRTFVAVDWCTGEIREENQIIKVLDTTDPVIDPIADLERPVNPFDCSAQVLLPIATASDNCTASNSITFEYSTELGEIINGVLYVDAPAKTMGDGIEITVTAMDCCGNEDVETFNISLVDQTPPVVVADAHEVISLLPNGQATMLATSIDDGSYDNCGPIAFGVKRMDNGVGNPSIDLFPPAGNDNAQFNEAVHFFCSDIDPENPVMVQFQVCDDADMDGIIGNGDDNCNTAMVEVEVQDKFAPIIQCPPNLTISCTEFEGIDVNDNAELDALFGSASVVGTCNPPLNVSVSASNDLNCGEGFITRTWTSQTAGGSDACTQTITVQAFNNNLLTCDRISFDGLNNFIYNWCAVNDNTNNNNDDLPAIDIDGCDAINVAEVIVNTAGLCTTAGVQVSIDTFNYAGSTACKKYIVHYEVIDHCVFDENYVNPNTGQIDPFNSFNGYFEFYLEYNVVDSEAPELTCTPVNVMADECAGFTGTISIEAFDACTPEEYLTYEFRIDVGGNGSVDLPINGGWFTGNAFTGANLGLSAIPVGNHIVLWRVDDGCGNPSSCSQPVTITPFLKAPTPYCLGGLSTAVMNTNGEVEIWAEDFDNGSEDDCGTPLTFTMIPEEDAQNSNNPYADSETGWTFGCEDIPNGVFANIEIRIYVTDATGEFDYCTVNLRVEDNAADFCTDDLGMATMSGAIKTETGKGLKNAMVELMSNQPEYPAHTMTDDEGQYSFNGLSFQDYELSAEKNIDFLNGVSTFDIVLIQKHILGLDVFESPYKLIAADVNNDCKVNGIDMVQIRKLLLGKYDDNELPDNESWRFVNENVVFDPLVQPCNYSESFEITEIENDVMNNNFVAVKIADVNESSNVNFDESEAEVRTYNQLNLLIENVAFAQNDVVRIPVYSSNMVDVKGFQFAIHMDGMMINGVERGVLGINKDYIGMQYAEEGVFIVSYNDVEGINASEDEVLFTILATATRNDELKHNLTIDNRFLTSESYLGEGLELGGIAFELRDGETSVELAAGFNLLQNEPNPFSEMTNIRFELPRSGKATLKVFDLQGRLLMARDGSFSKGMNYITVNKEDIGISGELFYQLEFDGKVQTKKMILIQ